MDRKWFQTVGALMRDEIQITEHKPLMAYLPAIYEELDPPDKPLERLLAAFEQILLGYEKIPAGTRKAVAKGKRGGPNIEGLGKKIEHLDELFDPEKTPEEFLPWLASWAALSIRSRLPQEKQRALIARIIPLYRIRGTRAYMEELLELCVGRTSVSEEEVPPLQLGAHCTVGEDTWVGGGPPHFFQVTMAAPELGALAVQARRQIAYEVIELAKPAHTVYDFVVISPHFQVGVRSTVGVDTVLGSAAPHLP